MVTCDRCEVECADLAVRVTRQRYLIGSRGPVSKEPTGTPALDWYCPECAKSLQVWMQTKGGE